MERLNEILGRSVQRRPQLPEPRSPQGADFQRSKPLQLQASNLYQTARSEQRSSRGSQVYSHSSFSTRAHHLQEEGLIISENRESRLLREPSTRPALNRHQGAPSTSISYQQRSYLPLPNTRSSSDSHHDDYALSKHVDVVEEWEEDAPSMHYGDWEEDDYEISMRTTKDVISNSRATYARTIREAHAILEPDIQTQVIHNPREMRMPSVLSSQPPRPQARTQELARPQRVTQPLNPRSVVKIDRERTVQAEPQALSRQAHAVKPREQYESVISTPLPPSKTICSKCRGAGYLRANVPFGHPNFGKPIACECKEAEKKEKRRQQLRDMSNLNAFRHNGFKTFNHRLPGVQEAYQAAVNYANNPDGWLLLVGPNGCGKTHLAAAIANQCLENGSVVLFAIVPDLLDHLRAAFAPTATEVYDQLFAKMREAEVLVLDDLGAQQSSAWANEKLFQLLNYRYNMGMPTVITANPKGIQAIDERIRSRLMDTGLVEEVKLDRARDYRPNHPRRAI